MTPIWSSFGFGTEELAEASNPDPGVARNVHPRISFLSERRQSQYLVCLHVCALGVQRSDPGQPLRFSVSKIYGHNTRLG